ncbi:MAG: DUF3990 domain-containing protein [Anaerolineaceae bacterium]|nr:DUF3990 domain-containing protein [Anaerolineaceae bacterium]
MIIFHGCPVTVEFPEIRISRFHKDFYYGFYTTSIYEQAKRWAVRFSGIGYVNRYEYTANPSLKKLTFPKMTEEWLDFIVSCRHGDPHDFDIGEGPMANDTIYNYIQDFVDGNISRKAFWELAKFKYPTHQISFHTARALETLHFIKADVVKEIR